jgi:hypothetical protein
MPNEALGIRPDLILQFEYISCKFVPILILHSLFPIFYGLLLFIFFFYRLRLHLCQDLCRKHANQTKIGCFVRASYQSYFLDFAHEQILPMNSALEGIIDNPLEDVVTRMRLTMTVLYSFKDGSAPNGMFFNSIFVCAFPIR